MAELKQWFRQVRCRFTGGHRYSDLELSLRYIHPTNSVVFCNKCVKCGMFKIWEVDAETLFWDLNRRAGDGK